jgi:hypothetical protein
MGYVNKNKKREKNAQRATKVAMGQNDLGWPEEK